MTEAEAQAWLERELNVPRETMERLTAYVGLLLDEATKQNLIAASTVPSVWMRHIVDSAQLLLHAPMGAGNWIDLGSGPGLPGIVAAILRPGPMHLVESRRKRVEFLETLVTKLGLENVTIHGQRIETLPSGLCATVISARAFAPLDRLLDAAIGLSRSDTVWLLPKGRQAESELASIAGAWQGVFHVEQSVTDPESAIIVARNVRRGNR